MNNFYQKYLSSKRILLMFAYIIIILLLIIFIINNFQKKEIFEDVQKQKDKIIKERVLKNLDNKDTDGDGLEDWQEHLYGTNIELSDTDSDGVSDLDEINLNRNPIVFGKGNLKSVDKIKKIELGIIGIKEQKKNLEEYKNNLKLKEKEKFELFLKNNKKTISREEYENRKSFIENKNIIKKDFNNIANIIIKFDSEININKTNDFKIFFNILTGNKYKQSLTEKQLNYIERVGGLDIKIAEELKNLDVKNNDVNNFKKSLEIYYRKIGESIISLVDKYGNKDIEKNKNDIRIYGNAVSGLVETRQHIHIFLESNSIKFSSYDEGKIFYYSL